MSHPRSVPNDGPAIAYCSEKCRDINPGEESNGFVCISIQRSLPFADVLWFSITGDQFLQLPVGARRSWPVGGARSGDHQAGSCGFAQGQAQGKCSAHQLTYAIPVNYIHTLCICDTGTSVAVDEGPRGWSQYLCGLIIRWFVLNVGVNFLDQSLNWSVEEVGFAEAEIFFIISVTCGLTSLAIQM